MNKGKTFEIIRYIIIGILTTLINYATYTLLNLQTAISTIISWFVSVLFAYIANKLFVFRKKNKIYLISEIIKFFSCRILSGVLDIIIMVIFVDVLNMNDDIVKLSSNFIIIIINYILSKYFVFKEKNNC